MSNKALLRSLFVILFIFICSNAFSETPQNATPNALLPLDAQGKIFDDSKSAPEGIRTSSRVYSNGYYYENYVFSHKWGQPKGTGDGEFNAPCGIAVDSSGNVYVVDTNNHRIQKFTSDGTFITKWATGGSRNGEFKRPQCIAVDSSGNVYVTNTYKDAHIQKFSSDGTFITSWGTEGHDDGEFYISDLIYSGPPGIAVDGFGNVYVADQGNNRIQKFTSDGTFITKWGSYGSNDGEFLSGPSGVAIDSSGNVYAVDRNADRIQKFTSDGTFITKWGKSGDGDGQFSSPRAVAVDGSGNVYVSEGEIIQKFTSDGTFITKWGKYGTGIGKFKNILGISVDSSGNVYVSDEGNNRIQKFRSNGKFIKKWGTYVASDGEFELLSGIAVDSSGRVYVTDYDNHRIQKFTSDGTFITKWSVGSAGSTGVRGVAVDSSRNVYVANSGNDRIQKYRSNGKFIKKWGTYGTGDGEFLIPYGVAVDSSGNVYVADTYNNRIQKFTSDGIFITTWGAKGSGEGEFYEPYGVAVDSSGNVYVADTYNHRIQKFTSSGTFITKWGTYGYPKAVTVDRLGNVIVVCDSLIQKFTSDGIALAAFGTSGSDDGELSSPEGIAVDSSGNIYVADTGNDRIQVFSLDPSGADLTVKKVSVPKSFNNNKKLLVETTIRNVGKSNVPASNISFYLSSYDFNSIGDNDIFIGSKSVKKLKKKQSTVVKVKWTVDAEPGKYYLKAKCDSEDVIIESNENNNVGVSKAVTIK